MTSTLKIGDITSFLGLFSTERQKLDSYSVWINTESMERLTTQVLNALYYFARNDIQASPDKIVALLGTERAQITTALCALETQGLARADVCRLSLSGLAFAHREFSGRPARAPLTELAQLAA